MIRPNSVNRIVEAVVSLGCFAVLSCLLTSGFGGSMGLAAAVGLILIGTAVAWILRHEASGQLWRVLTTLGLGLAVFSAFRYAGLVEWPMGRPDALRSYLLMLYSHVVLALTILASVLWGAYGKGAQGSGIGPVRFGQWLSREGVKGLKGVRSLKGGEGGKGEEAGGGMRWLAGQSRASMTVALSLIAGACWFWAGGTVTSTGPSVPGPVWAFGIAAVAKACLTGLTEEVCYRGVIQAAAIARFGALAGILYQACLYAAFHVNLGPVFFGRVGFLASVLALGLIFGAVTRLTSGIGWACVVHIALDVVVEWQNVT